MHILFSGILIWFVVSELFFGFSANKVYAKALKKVKASAEVRNEKLGLSELYITYKPPLRSIDPLSAS